MDIVCFSHLRWDFVFQRPQHLMTRWARDRRVFFVEEPVAADAPGLDVKVSEQGVRVVTPRLPSGDAPAGALGALLEKFVADERLEHWLAWYYTPSALAFTEGLSPAVTVYDCMDELSNFKGASASLKDMEKRLCARADLIFTGGQSLYEAKRAFHRSVFAFPSAVDTAHFAAARRLTDEPEDQRSIPHPRLGFFGVIDERMDLQLLRALAERRPDWHLVIIGPVVKIDPDSVPRLPNIHYLGRKSYPDLPKYLAGWDVAIMPFARNEATRYISPTKTPEYLAGGKPVVSTSIRDVVHPYGDLGLAEIADTAEEFEAAALRCLRAEPFPRQARADEFLRDISWENTWSAMRSLVDKVAASKSPHPHLHLNGIPRHARAAFDYLVVGAGFAGSVIAERLAESGNKKVLICDVRPHVGGNAYDHPNEDGIIVHRYGPHIFHTNSTEVFIYLSQFTRWRPYEHRVLASVDGKLVPVPINLDTVNKLYGLSLDSAGVEEFYRKLAEPRAHITTSEDVIVSKVGRELYEKMFKNYTRKQWGLDASQLDSSVIARIPVRTDRDDRYFTDTHQAMPLDGYTAMFENMLRHPNITIEVGVDYRKLLPRVSYKELIYTGPIDAFFDNCFGKLPYRSLEFKHQTLDTPRLQPVAVINHPNEHDYTRVTEFKHLTGQRHPRTAIVYEYPRAEGDPYYPIPRPENARLYKRYEALAQATPHVHFCGRLGTYKYYNMDQVVAQALTTAAKLLGMERKELIHAD